MSSYRAQASLAAGFGLLAVGCGIPDQKVDLRTEGPPEVTAVLVVNENHDEAATYCSPDDDKVPVIITGGCGPGFGFDCCTDCIGICPEVGEDVPSVQDAVANADPLSWYARVVFDELIDPDVEELFDTDTGGACTDDSRTCTGTIANTQPVELECGGAAVPYDGWYNPAGNNVSIPPGPSLVVIPAAFVATSSDCTITMTSTIVDKDGVAATGSFNFSIDPLDVLGTDPPAGETTVVAADVVFDVSFNALLDVASVDADEIILEDSGGTAVAATVTVEGGTELLVIPDAPLTNDETYTLTIPADSDFADVAGGGATITDDIVITITVEPAA